MEPQIQYVRSADGTAIATFRLGQGGEPIVFVPSPFSLCTFGGRWQLEDLRAGYARLAGRRLVAGYDPRGQGLSDTASGDFSLDARVADLAAVVESAGTAQVNVFASGMGAMEALRFAAEEPGRVRRLILWHGGTRSSDLELTPTRRVLSRLIDVDWQVYLRMLALDVFGWENGRLLEQDLRENVRQEPLLAAFAAREMDVTDVLAEVRCPTLVVYLHEVGTLSVDAPRRIATTVPLAQLKVVDGRNTEVFLGAVEGHVRVIEEFLGEMPRATGAVVSGMAAILFTDIADSVALTEKMGDAAFRAAAKALDARVRAAMREAGGTPVEGKVLGDGVMAVFNSAVEAIDGARRCIGAGTEAALPLHAGVHAGDVIRDEGNVYGGAVNIAARVCALSAAGEVLVTATVRDLARTSAGAAFEDRGERDLKGIAEPVRVYAVRAE